MGLFHMGRRTVVVLAVLAGVFALALASPLSASAEYLLSNEECLVCHVTGGIAPGINVDAVGFNVGTVDKATACPKCHIDSLTGSHPFHNAGGDCSAVCHRNWGPSLPSNTPSVLTAVGSFAAADSPSSSAFVIHTIHSNPRWMASETSSNSKCGSCHATAACTACHDNTNLPAIDASHEGHDPLDTWVEPWIGDVSVGVASSQAEDTMLRDEPIRCGEQGCHDLGSADDNQPVLKDSFTHIAYPGGYQPTTVTKVGTWREISGKVYTLSREAASNYTNSTLSITFDGERISLVADKDPYRGIMEVKIDGVTVANVDQYASTTQYQRVLYTSGNLGAGPHTMTVRPTGTKNVASRATWITFDQLKVFVSANETVAGLCRDCHFEQADADTHQGMPFVFEDFDHVVTETVNATNTATEFNAYGTYACVQCHTAPIRDEHARTNTPILNYPDSCSVCHAHANSVTEAALAAYRTPVGTTWSGTYSEGNGCEFADCHNATWSRTRHNSFASKHTTITAGEGAACMSCHPGELRAVHNNSIPGNSKVETNGCLACHSDTKLDTNKSCSGTNSASGSCHSGGFNTVGSHALDSAASHNASEAGKPFTRAYQGAADIDDGSVECAVCHSDTLVAAHNGTVPAVGCATGGVAGKGCHLDTAYNSINVAANGWTSRKCSDCHDYAAKQSHDNTATPHLVASNGCAGSAAKCHPSNDLWKLHEFNYFGSPTSQPNKGCGVTGCHSAANKDIRPAVNFTNSCGSGGTCHTGYTIAHVDAYQHAFSGVSYYNGATETGCTNQTGCHNAGIASTADFGAPHHASSGCLQGGCHTAPEQPSFRNTNPIECQECHIASAYTGAAPRTLLTASPAAGGHYSDTTHTATAASMDDPVTAGGTASATCDNCHSATIGGLGNGLMNQHSDMTVGGTYGIALTCGECHGDTRARGNAEVVANWTNNVCADCHAAGTTSVLDHATTAAAVAEVGSTCGSTGTGCHNSTDLHALHKNDAGGCNLTGCHNYSIQTHRPTAKGCGGATSCHAGYTNTVHGSVTTGNEAGHTDTVMTGTITQGAASATCANCHSGGLGTAHATSMTGWADICTGCHTSTLGNSVSPAQVAANWTNNDCLDCHAAGTADPNKIGNWHSRYGTASHQGTTTQGCGSSGAGCHDTLDLAALHGVNLVNGCAVTGCHDAQNKAMGSAAKSCGSGGTCHNTYTATFHGAGITGNDTTHTALGLTAVLDATYNPGGANTCNVCHAAGLTSAHTTMTANLTSPSWVSPFCAECHSTDVSPVTGSAAVIKTTKWPAKSCEECHGGSNGPAKHTEYVTGHVGSDGANNCATPSCHGNTYDLRQLHNNPIGGNASTAGCDSAGCHDSQNKDMQSAQKLCGSGTGGCHTDKTDANHGSATAHPFTSSSYYDLDFETGCTNQPGCHNQTGSDTSDYSSGYHPSSGCETGACHISVSKAGYAGDGDCDSCHDSNYTGGADRIPVNGNFPAGHYSETTHTAVGMTNTLSVGGGSASASCNDCHGPGIGGAGNALANQHTQISIGGSPYGTALSCGECHGDLRVNGLTEVGNNWSTNACIDCHTIGNTYSPFDHASTVPAVNESGSSCGNTGINCHVSTELHELHKNAAGGCNLTGCHNYSQQANVPTALGCGGATSCHTGYTNTTHTHAADAAKHQPTTLTQANATQWSVACGSCHDIRNSNASLTLEHDLATSVKSASANNCLNCHNNTASTTAVTNNWSAKDTTGACAACHTGGLAIHADENTAAHSTEANTGCASTGAGCHNSADLSKSGPTNVVNTNIHNSCLRCHDRTGAASWSTGMIGTAGNLVYAPTAKKCGQATGCHTSASYNPASGYHRIGRGDVVDGNDVKHTDADMTGTLTSGVASASCSTCHSGGLTTAHAASLTGWTNVCTECHNSTLGTSVSPAQVKGGWTSDDCLDCHAAGASGTKVPNWHSKYGTASHQGTTTQGCGSSGVGCHQTLDLAALHGITETSGCALTGCHDAQNKAMGLAAKSCGVGGTCHNTYTATSHGASTGDDANHTDSSMTGTVGSGANNTCAACHAGTLTAAHPTSMTGWTDVCAGCHNSTAGGSVSPAQVAANWSTNDCLDCHTAGASAVKIPNWHSKWATTSHQGVITPVGDNCNDACHSASYSDVTMDLADIHDGEVLGCKVAGCHTTNGDMTAAGKSCGEGGACHTTYRDGNHGFNLGLHTTTSENSWKNCGRCHLGQRADYTRTGAFNGNLVIDTDANTIDLHEIASGGTGACSVCHDGGATQALISAGATADCESCHVDHRIEVTDYTLSTTKSTSSANIVKTLELNYDEQDLSNIGVWLATSDNAVPAYARIVVGDGSVIDTSTSTTAMDPLRKKVYFRNLPVSSITGTQTVKLYLWTGSSTATAMAEHFEVCVSRGDMINMHTADVGGFTCGFGDCHDSNVVAQHQPYKIPGAFTGTYSWPSVPTRENLTPVMGSSTAGAFTKVKSLTLNMDDIDKIRMRLNVYGSSATKSGTISFRVQVGTNVIASGSAVTTNVQKFWDYSDTGTDPAGNPLNFINTTAYSGNTTFDLYLSTSTSLNKPANNVFQIWSGERIYEEGTPTDACDLCHLSTVRYDNYGNEQTNDTSLGPDTPKLSTFDPQCDTCHPYWQDGHPQFSHRSDARADTCLAGCHQFTPAINGTDLGLDKYDLTKQHVWGDNSNTGISYTASATVATENFGTITTWPANLTRSDATYVTVQTANARSGAAAQINPNTGTPTDYSFDNTTAYDLSAWRGGTVQFYYTFNGSDANDYLICEYTTTSTVGYTQLWKTSTDALTWTLSPVLDVPGDGPVFIRFRSKTNTTDEYARIDDLTVMGASRTLPGTMEAGCGIGPNGACHATDFPTTGKCSDCHASVNHHNVVHDLSVGGTRSSGVQTGFAYDNCIGVCHVKNLHFSHGVGLSETEPRPYRAPGTTVDSIMTCATCHDSANATIKTMCNSSATTPIASGTIMCADCHTGTAGMASVAHAGVPSPITGWRTDNFLKGSNLGYEFNSARTGGHNVVGYTRAYTNNYRVVTGATTGAWYRADVDPSIGTAFTFNTATSPGLRATTVDGLPLKNGSATINTGTAVHCIDCHGDSAATLEGPQGAATTIAMWGDTSTMWAAATATSMSTTVCNRCHDFTNNATSPVLTRGCHSANAQHISRCVTCHSAIPHAWKRPRFLISLTRDSAPYLYDASIGGINGVNIDGTTATDTSTEVYQSSGNCNTTKGTVCTKAHTGTVTAP